jgi:MFS family permease
MSTTAELSHTGRRVARLPRAFWTLWAGTVINRLGLVVEPFLALYLSSRHLPLSQIGMVIAASGAGSVFSMLIGGSLADKIGRRSTLTLGMLANGATLLVLGYARGLVPLVFATLAYGLTVDMYRPAVSALIADLVPASDRVRAYGLLYWAINLGGSVAMVLGGALARSGFSLLFWLDAGTCVIFGLLVWHAVPESRGATADPGKGGFAQVIRDPVMVTFCLISLVVASVYMQAFTTLPLAMHRAGLTVTAYGLAMSVNGIVIVVTQPLIGSRLARFDSSYVLACGILFYALGFGLTSMASATWEYGLTVAVWTIGEILISAVSAAIVAALAPAHLRGRYSGVFGVTFSLGYLAAPLIGTSLLGISRYALWLSCAGACVVAAAGQVALRPAVVRRSS